MLFAFSLAVVLLLQALPAIPQESRLDLQQIIRDEAALSSVEIWYSVDAQVVALRGDGTVVMQSVGQQPLSLLPTCYGKVTTTEVRQVLERMLEERFLDLPRKSYMMINADVEDWRRLQLHSIGINTVTARVRRSFVAGEYGHEHQEIPAKFADVEKVIIGVKAKGILPGSRCTVSPPLRPWDDSTVPVLHNE